MLVCQTFGGSFLRTDDVSNSRQAIKKYVRANNKLGSTTDAAFDKHISHALKHGEDTGDFERPKGPSGPVKLAKKTTTKKEAAPKTTKSKSDKAPAKKSTTKTASKKSTTTTTKVNKRRRVQFEYLGSDNK